ncbi:hypothetical protein LTR62_006520 [Meristemomyces frigidus]|uniref:DUF7707 domain-containing protein n=1 Tax=Meristemomyces frigidus TaxID=1508187 RepID=A0AAN7TDZ1_9PEZI|nr:hypothetical protein LTR62_006520 [Meristemomyces frigidus]
MKSYTTLSAASALLLSAAVAQQTYQIDPTSVSNSTREYWCQQQTAQCPLICLQTNTEANTIANSCDPTTLAWSCVCANGISPNVTQFSQTVPFFECQEWGTQCVSNCGTGNTACQSACQQDHPCGAQNPVRQNTSTLSSTMSSTASGSGAASSAGTSTTGGSGGQSVYSGFGGAAASSTGGSAAQSTGSGSSAATSKAGAASLHAAALNVGQTFGVLGLVGAMFGGFAVLL